MPIVNRTNAFIGDTDAKASEVNQDFDKLYNVINGDLDELNLNLERKDLQLALLEALKLVDGDGSGLDADLVGGEKYSKINPPGIIVMWSGATTNVPDGWTLCDGKNNTPDLTDRFIVGAGSKYNVGDTGGAESVALTGAQLPSHTHGSGTLGTNLTGAHTHTWSDTSSSSGNHSHSGSTSTNGNHSHSYTKVKSVAVRWQNTNSSRMSGSTTANTGSAGNHSHSLSINSNGAHTHDVSGTTSSNGKHSHTISGSTASTGSGNSHENRPPFYALAYIMKL